MVGEVDLDYSKIPRLKFGNKKEIAKWLEEYVSSDDCEEIEILFPLGIPLGKEKIKIKILVFKLQDGKPNNDN